MGTSSGAMILLLATVTVFLCSSLLVDMVNRHVPAPYMDEIFHVDQMQEYCGGNFSAWNPKITTPPGLYLATLAVIKPVLRYFSDAKVKVVCSVQLLRFVNPVFLTITFIIITESFRLEFQRSGNLRNKVDGIAVTIFPILLFSSLLYYTDVASVLSVLLMHHLNQRNLSVFGALIGACACLMRQTNIIWALFCAGLTLERIAMEFLGLYLGTKLRDSQKMSKSRSRTLKDLASDLFEMSQKKPGLFGEMLVTMFAKMGPYVMLCSGFLVFVIVNGGVAVGDKSAHEALCHLPQLYYWTGFTLFFGAPYFLQPSHIRSTLKSMWDNIKLSGFLMIVMLLGVHCFTYEHAYLLADNRHYTFYVWKNWFRRHWAMKYLLIPVYLFAQHAIANSLSHKSVVWRLGFLLCTALVTIPNKLLEFRYFIIPFLFWRMSVDPRQYGVKAAVVEILLFVIINAVTIYMFLFRSFRWSHEPGTQRFMW